jgi:hypothetical protein
VRRHGSFSATNFLQAERAAIPNRLTFHPSSDNDYHTGLAGYQVVLVGSGPGAQAVRRQNLVRYLRARFAWREQRHAAGVSETP